MTYSNFARRKGSKDKTKRTLKTAGAVGGGLALAAGARYGLGLLGKKVVKAQSLLTGSNQKALPAGRKGGAITNIPPTIVYTRPVSRSSQKALKGSNQKALPPGRDRLLAGSPSPRSLPPSTSQPVKVKKRKQEYA